MPEPAEPVSAAAFDTKMAQVIRRLEVRMRAVAALGLLGLLLVTFRAVQATSWVIGLLLPVGLVGLWGMTFERVRRFRRRASEARAQLERDGRLVP